MAAGGCRRRSCSAAPAQVPSGPALLCPCPPPVPTAERAASPRGLIRAPGSASISRSRSISRHLSPPVSLKKAAAPASAQSTAGFSGLRLASALSSPRPALPFGARGSPLQGPSLTPSASRSVLHPGLPCQLPPGSPRAAGWFCPQSLPLLSPLHRSVPITRASGLVSPRRRPGSGLLSLLTP